MRKESLEFLKKMIDTPSPSGFETEIQALCAKYARPFSDKIHKDVHGNQYHVVNPKGTPRIMLAGHVDEIGLMVNDIDDNGYIGFVSIGGVDPSILDGHRVKVWSEKGPVCGVIGRTAIHLTDSADRGKPLQMHQLWVDIGAKNGDDAKEVVAVGDAITIDEGYTELRNGRAAARAFDDRIGGFVILEALRLLKSKKKDLSAAVIAVTTVQEEIGLRGAKTSAFHCDPDAAVAVDVGHAVDHPNVDTRRFRESKLGEGPILYRGANINPVVEKQLFDVAKEKKIPYQVAASPRATGTDANAIQVSKSGVATAILGVPCRYMHSPVEVISLNDVENAAKLIADWIMSVKKGVSFIP